MDLEDFEVVHHHLDLLCLLNFNYYVKIGIHKNGRQKQYPAANPSVISLICAFNGVLRWSHLNDKLEKIFKKKKK